MEIIAKLDLGEGIIQK